MQGEKQSKLLSKLMIELRNNSLIITLPENMNTTVFNEIIDFVDSRLNKSKEMLSLIEEYHHIEPEFRFDREEAYNERLHIH
ncbi:MAG: hypothetical protein ABRQ39_04890 [Candidatus Eremiobacterota bacterium]